MEHMGYKTWARLPGCCWLRMVWCMSSRSWLSPGFTGFLSFGSRFGCSKRSLGAWFELPSRKLTYPAKMAYLKIIFDLGDDCHTLVHPGRLTWNRIMEVWFRSFSFLFHGWFVGSMLIFQGVFLLFIAIYGNDPVWRIFFRWVETTN